MKSYFIKNISIWTPENFRTTSVLMTPDEITEVSEEMVAQAEDVEIINGDGLHLLPGLVDMHVHFREPGFEYKETIKTGSEAAAHGGFTTVCTMPNLKPAPDSRENLQTQVDAIKKDAKIDILPYATITRSRLGQELIDYESLKDDVAGFSDDGSGIQSESVMREAMTQIASTGAILAAHCEVESLLEGGYIHKGKYAETHGHRGICSESEWGEVKRNIRLSDETGCHLHVCHISTKESVDLIRDAKSRGISVTCETGPHYLMLDDSSLKEEGRFKMNPPIRDVTDKLALREGIADGTIDVIATDHAPHSAEEKSRGLEKSAMGVVGLETALAASYTTLVKEDVISLHKLIDVMAVNPRKILGLDSARVLGPDPCVTLVDFNQKYIVNPANFLSKGKATPFEGIYLTGKVLMTVNHGNVVWKDDQTI